MHGRRTWRWWVMRFELAIGIGVAVIVVALLVGVMIPASGWVTTDPRPIGQPWWSLLSLATLGPVVLLAIGLTWMIRIFRGPSDEPPPWRYRVSAPAPGRQRLTPGTSHRGTPRPERAPGWWPTRVLLAIGIGSVLLIGLGLLARTALLNGLGEPGPVSLGPLAIPWYVAISIAELAVPVVGLIWMIRIFRGPSDEPPPWRYRSR